MGGGRNAEEGVPEEEPQDPSRNTHEAPAQHLEPNPWGTNDVNPAITPAAPSQHAPVVPAILAPGGGRLGAAGAPPQLVVSDLELPPIAPDRLHNAQPQAAPPSPGNENNPFLKKLAHEQTGNQGSSPPTGSLGQMSLNEPRTNPWGTVPSHGTGSSSIYSQSPAGGASPWSMEPPQQPSSQPVAGQPPSSTGDEELLIWEDEPSHPGENTRDEKQGLDAKPPLPEKVPEPETQDSSLAPEAVPTLQKETSEGWNLIDHEPRPGEPPATQERAPVDDSPVSSEDRPAPSTSPRVPGREATEMYHIIRIKWHDHKARENPRMSPILVQNANGPCPLVALVNALILTAPADATETPLTQSLQSREQISMDLLLQAVVEELMASPRRPSDAVLPDLTDLYNFLRGLDTGMNANPRFVPSDELPSFLDGWLANVPPSERDTCVPGGFEQTKEMELYSAFSIPLIHGWLPSPTGVVCESLKRRAESYEEAQHVLFQEEELQGKLENPQSMGLTPEEQDAYQDILIIKDFLQASATQLTTVGLEVIVKAMPPGSVAILFRNDHFSTLYKHPEAHTLHMLVSDSEFAGHEGTVWETFNDVTGKSEFLSGDFRPVGGAAHPREGTAPRTTTTQDGWQAAAPAPGREPARSPNHEQEDQDFAMALQLQEEEDERHRQEQQARRQRERRLSEQMIDQQGRHPPLPSRLPSDARTGLRRPGQQPQHQPTPPPQPVRPLVPPRGGRPAPQQGGTDEAPPSYDESANDAPFRPPVGHPSHPASSPGREATSPRPQGRPQPVAGGAGGTVGWNAGGVRPPIRRPIGPAVSSRERDCTVM